MNEAVVAEWVLARQRLEVLTDNAHTYCDFAPTQGLSCKILWAAGSHNDPVARDCQFTLVDAHSGHNTALQNLVNRATNVLHPLYDGAGAYLPGPFVLRLGHTLRFYVPLAAAGTVITLALYLQEFVGEDAYAG